MLRTQPTRSRARTFDRDGAVIVFGELGNGNLGNDGSLAVLLNVINQADPDAHVHVVGYEPATLQQRMGVTAESMNLRIRKPRGRLLTAAGRVVLRLLDFGHTFQQVHRARAVVIPGAGVFEGDLGTKPTALPLAFWRLSMACRLAGVPLLVVSVGLSPVHERLSQRLFSSGLRHATYASYRDQRSLRLARKWVGRLTHGQLSADLAFATDLPVERPSRPVVAVGVMANGGGRDPVRQSKYESEMVALVDLLTATGREVRLVIGDLADCPLMESIRDRAARPDLVECRTPSTLTELADDFADVTAVVATRFHNVVMSLRMNRTTVAVAYGAKTGDLMNRCGLADLSVPLDRFSAPDTLRLLDQAIAEQRRPDAAQLESLAADLRVDLDRVAAILRETS